MTGYQILTMTGISLINKNTLVCLAVCFFSFFTVIGQDQLILENGQILKGSVLYINKTKVKFEDAYSGDRKWYKNVDKLIDNEDGVEIEYKIRNIKGLESFLSGALVSGKASLYLIHKPVPGMEGISTLTYLYKEGEAEAKQLHMHSVTTNFYKRMSKYVEDCPDLASKIKKKEYHYQDIIEILETYNSGC